MTTEKIMAVSLSHILWMGTGDQILILSTSRNMSEIMHKASQFTTSKTENQHSIHCLKTQDHFLPVQHPIQEGSEKNGIQSYSRFCEHYLHSEVCKSTAKPHYTGKCLWLSQPSPRSLSRTVLTLFITLLALISSAFYCTAFLAFNYSHFHPSWRPRFGLGPLCSPTAH